MKKTSLPEIIGIAAFAVFVLVSHTAGFKPGQVISGNFWDFFTEMMIFLPAMFVLIGLFDVWFPKEAVEKHVGKEAGIRGILWIILLATLQAGSLYGAFPVAYMLWKKGAGVRNVFIYLGAFSSLKIPMLMFEIGFLGLKFSLLRAIITLPVFIIIGFIMESMFDKKFEMRKSQ